MEQNTAHEISSRVAESAAGIAETATGWKKWLLTAVALFAGAVAWFTSTVITEQAEEPATEQAE